MSELLARHGGACLPALEGHGPDVGGVQVDSRVVQPGDLFAALPGSVADGSRFVSEALDRGAVAVLSPKALPNASARVPNWIHAAARRVAGKSAADLHGNPSQGMFVVAVTGTNGKTTTAHLTGQLLERVGRRPAVLGTAGNRLADGVWFGASHTTADAPALQALLARHKALAGDSVALELSSHALDQERHAGLEISVAQFTNLTQDHLDYHGDMARYSAAKEALFSGLRHGAHAVINQDDATAERMAAAARSAGAKVHTYSTRSRADLWADDVESDPQGTRFWIQGMGILRTRVRLPLWGEFNVSNALAALAAVLLSDASPADCLAGLASVSPAAGRLERVDDGGRGVTLLVDYAHSEDALRKVLATLRAHLAPGARLVCVFGCGGDRDRTKRPRMGAAVAELADIAVVTSDNPRSEDPAAIAAQIVAGMQSGAEPLVELDRRAAIALALAEARPGDIVLVAGKGHESTQTVGKVAHPFDDRIVLAELVRELAGRK
ncbi:MAG TPA: UDP-N-acetylmuramoyl-L-alanyl-D-glutamate--2,6-diaminopimelate ligase [Planctomycetota bacterium]|nr:UDP-N-acetylmuramoyl-L-alanyl-D-glutamate--2,6-diaminopimelate ligase [Planctomycetota bacterium]